ncbi:MAG: hypothetical protein AAF191_19915 [Verrucomicrobiota bacterium]
MKPGFEDSQVEKVLAQKGAFAFPVLATTRLRHFTQGVAIGSKAYVEEIFIQHRAFFGKRRVDGARKIPKLPKISLVALRELRG